MTFKFARLLVALFAAAAIPVLAQNLAVVNGKPIPSSRADDMVKQITARGQKDTPQLRDMVKQELITREMLVQEADKAGISSSADVKGQLEMARQQIVIQAFIADFLKKNPISDAEVKAEYDRYKEQVGDKEYHARHILVDKEDDAKAIITKLKAGAKFEDLAKQQSKDGSAANGGDLDWMSPAGLDKSFADAMVALKKGQMTETPVKSQFGYHVIQLEDVRTAKVPPLEELKPQITEALQKNKLQAYEKELHAKAKIQ